MKINLKRIKGDLINKGVNRMPDYEGFFRTEKGVFFAVGWLKPTSSDLDLTIKKVDEDFLKNSFNLKKYSLWIENLKNR